MEKKTKSMKMNMLAFISWKNAKTRRLFEEVKRIGFIGMQVAKNPYGREQKWLV